MSLHVHFDFHGLLLLINSLKEHFTELTCNLQCTAFVFNLSTAHLVFFVFVHLWHTCECRSCEITIIVIRIPLNHQHKTKRPCHHFQQAYNYMLHQPIVMCYLVGVPQSDSAAQGKLSHQQVIHPAKGKL